VRKLQSLSKGIEREKMQMEKNWWRPVSPALPSEKNSNLNLEISGIRIEDNDKSIKKIRFIF